MAHVDLTQKAGASLSPGTKAQGEEERTHKRSTWRYLLLAGLVGFCAAISSLLGILPQLVWSGENMSITGAVCGDWVIYTRNNVGLMREFSEVTKAGALSKDNIWVVGHTHAIADNTEPGLLSLHFDGPVSSVLSNPIPDNYGYRPETDLYLNDIATIAPNDIWAVGKGFANGHALIQHWDGAKWSMVQTPQMNARYVHLEGISALGANDIWAVGTMQTEGYVDDEPVILHWNGKAWNISSVENVEADSLYGLNGIYAIGERDVWAVGYSLGKGPQSSTNHALALHWDGKAWNKSETPNLSKEDRLSSVTATASDDVWAVGSSDKETLILHWDGSKWSHVPSPNRPAETSFTRGSESTLADVAAFSKDDVWAVGWQIGAYPFNANYDYYVDRTLALHWNGVAWSLIPSPNGYQTQKFSGLTIADNTLWAVGQGGHMDGESVLLARFDGKECSSTK